MSEGFLGITAHFVEKKNYVRHHITISCVTFPPPHTAENIYKLFKLELEKFNVKSENVSVVMTDNAANMIAAFKLYDNNLDDCLTEDDELKTIEDAMVQRMLDDDEPLKDDDEAAKMVVEFEQFELQAATLFTEYPRYPCFLHTLQLVVQLFEKNEAIKVLLVKARSIVNSFNHSFTATTALIQRFGGLKLISDNRTRWSSTLLLAERMVKLQTGVETIIVVDKLVKVQNLTQGEWLILKGIVKFLGKFKMVREITLRNSWNYNS